MVSNLANELGHHLGLQVQLRESNRLHRAASMQTFMDRQAVRSLGAKRKREDFRGL